jgi:single-strand DNA-binding protein
MASLNKVMLVGRLGRDPEMRYTKSGSAVASFSIATDERWKDKQGNRQEHTEWHNIVAWTKLADFAQNYLKKGMLIFVEGQLRTRDWTDNANVKHYRTEIRADNIQFMEPKGDGPRAGGGGAARPQSPSQSQDRGPSGPPMDEGPEPPGGGEYLEDDIPF